MTLDVDIRYRRGDFRLDVAFQAQPGLTALFGRSGAGKTTIVDVIAGLLMPDHARVVVDGVTLTDTARGISVPVHQRQLGYVFQEPRLFPHLSVGDNLCYGRRFQNDPAPARELERVVELLGLNEFLARRPATLSGGEKQRVAIGRALLASPRVLLMDEPLSSLDDARKQEILPYLERLRDDARLPILYVSHSVPEVARLAVSIVLLSRGEVAASGPAASVMQRIDLFPLTGKAEAGALIEVEVAAYDPVWDLTRLKSRAGDWQVPGRIADPGVRLRMRVRARDVMLSRSQPSDVSALNVMSGTIAEIGASHGAVVEVRLDCSGEALTARLTRLSVDRLGLSVGIQVYALIKSVAIERRSLGRT
jgi:molybdate transport system ATP-binding protein